ncbi:MAG: hypothetical protein IPM21_15640 [Acidobacteria bacterium]|nr:hypothetical protein [Acidobacteriota bacterium]
MNDELKRAVRELDDDLVRNNRRNEELFAKLSELQVSLGLLHDDRPICPFLRPFFLSRDLYSEISKAARVVSGAFAQVALAALEDPKIAKMLGVTEKEMVWAKLDPGYSGVTVNSRLDTYIYGNEFKFLEYNAENPAGIGDQQSLKTLFAEVPEVKHFLAANKHYFPQPHQTLLESLVSAYREYGGTEEKPQIAIVDWDGVSTAAEFEILARHFEACGHRTLICDPENLEYDGKVLSYGDFRIDIFFKRVIIHEFLERFDESHPLYKACRDGNVCMANAFRAKLAHKKAGYAIVTDERYSHLLTSEQIEMATKHLPWTRRVTDERTKYEGKEVELLESLRRERERFVLKPSDDYGGEGVKLGWESSESEWEAALEDAIDNDFVVQEKAPVDKIRIASYADGEAFHQDLLVDFDPFLFRGSVEGGMVRLSADSIVNITQGGGETGLVILG